jgi:hypothetical protein
MVEPPFVGRYRVYPASAMRRPRAEGPTHPSRSGGAGAPPGGTMTSRQELADGGHPARPRFEMRLPAKGRIGEPWGAPATVARSAARRRQDAATARR